MKPHYWLTLFALLPLPLITVAGNGKLRLEITTLNDSVKPAEWLDCEYRDILKYRSAPGSDEEKIPTLVLDANTAVRTKDALQCRKILSGLAKLDQQETLDELAAILVETPCEPDAETKIWLSASTRVNEDGSEGNRSASYIINSLSISGCVEQMPPACKAPHAVSFEESRKVAINHQQLVDTFLDCLDALIEVARIKKQIEAVRVVLPKSAETWEAYHQSRLAAGLGHAEAEPRFIGPLLELDGIGGTPFREQTYNWGEYELYEAMDANGSITGFYLESSRGERLPVNPQSSFLDIRPFYRGVAQVMVEESAEFKLVSDGAPNPSEPLNATEPPVAQANYEFGDNRASWILINERGERISSQQWTRLYPFRGGYARIKYLDEDGGFTTSLIDLKGRIVNQRKLAENISGVVGGVFAMDDPENKDTFLWTPEGQPVATPIRPQAETQRSVTVKDEGLIHIADLPAAWYGGEVPSQDTILFKGIDLRDKAAAAKELIRTAYEYYAQAKYTLGQVPAVHAFYWPERVEWLAAEAKRVDPGNAYVHKMHGWCLFNLGFDERALEQFRKSIELSDREVTKDLRAGLAICYWHLGDKDKASQHYQNLVKLDPDYGKADLLATLSWTKREKEALIELQKGL